MTAIIENKIKSRITIIIIIIILVFILTLGLFGLSKFDADRDIRQLRKLNNSLNLQWGLINQGQTVNNKAGVFGIDINIINAWKMTKGEPDVIVGILDSGIDIDHVELCESIYFNSNETLNGIDDDQNGYIDDLNGWNFYADNNHIFESYLHDYHGTFVCAVISASHQKGVICGVAPNVKILPLKFIHGSKGDLADAIEAIEYAYSLGVRIINCSWDNTNYNEELYQTINQFSDVLFVCSSGKSAKDIVDRPIYPACYGLPNIITVAAVDNGGELFQRTGYGCQVDISAPGADIFSAMPEGDYTYASGTSYAVAYVTGISALIKSVNPGLTAVEIVEIIKNSRTELASLQGKISTNGIINADQCLKIASSLLFVKKGY